MLFGLGARCLCRTLLLIFMYVLRVAMVVLSNAYFEEMKKEKPESQVEKRPLTPKEEEDIKADVSS